MNSFRSVYRAINYEIERQTNELNSNKVIVQETRGWNESKGITISQRSKESAHDYRYFPDPDLPNIYIDEELLSDLKKSIPELKKDRVDYLLSNYELNEQVIQILSSDINLYNYFKNIELPKPRNSNITDQDLANWITEEIIKILDSNKINTDKISSIFKPNYLIELIELTNSKKINRNGSRNVLSSMVESRKSPKDLIDELGLAKIADSGQLNELCIQAVNNNPDAVSDFNSGKETAVKFLIGQVMKLSKGKADPKDAELNILKILKNEK